MFQRLSQNATLFSEENGFLKQQSFQAEASIKLSQKTMRFVMQGAHLRLLPDRYNE